MLNHHKSVMARARATPATLCFSGTVAWQICGGPWLDMTTHFVFTALAPALFVFCLSPGLNQSFHIHSLMYGVGSQNRTRDQFLKHTSSFCLSFIPICKHFCTVLHCLSSPRTLVNALLADSAEQLSSADLLMQHSAGSFVQGTRRRSTYTFQSNCTQCLSYCI